MNQTMAPPGFGAGVESGKTVKRVVVIGVGVILLLLLWLLGFLPFVFGVLVPYAAMLVFTVGFIAKVVNWGRSPVPFKIPTTCGQQTSLPWIKPSRLDNPATPLGVAGRMFLEVVFFRSLFRNTRAILRKDGPKLGYLSDKILWLAALAFHWSFLFIFLRHLRFFTEPVPGWVMFMEDLDGIFQVGLPILFITDVVILAALCYLLGRRLFDAKIRYISLPSDYMALGLVLGVVITGVLTRHVFKTDLVTVKRLAMGLFTLHPVIPAGGALNFSFYVHLLFVSALLAYFPFSKLMHMPGVFLSPTRNLANDSRARRHVNPWNPAVKVHTYEEYEDEFRDKMKAAGLPLEKE